MGRNSNRSGGPTQALARPTQSRSLLGLPLLVVSLPLILLDEMAQWGSILRETGGPGMSGYFVVGPAIAAGYLASLPFLVGGLPWEFSDAPEAQPQPGSRPADAARR